MTAPVSDPGFYADFSGLAALKRGAKSEDPQALREAARQFESLFARMLLSSMRAASFGDSLTGSDQQQFYQGMFDDQLAVDLTKGRGLGLADLLVEQLTRAGLVNASSAGAQTQLATPLDAGASHETGSRSDSAAHGSGSTASPLASPATWNPATREQFVRDLWPHAQAAAKELGVDPETLIAHAALESGWGQSMPGDHTGRSSFNLFGIKAGSSWNGSAVPARTLEFENAVPVSRTERFRAYDSPASSFRDYVALLRNNPRYESALGKGTDTQAFAQALQNAGYATDPNYAHKLAATADTVRQLDAARAFKIAAHQPLTTGTIPF